MRFLDFAVDTFIQEAEKYGHKAQMLESFRTESDEQLVERVLSVIDNLEIAFAWQERNCIIHDRNNTAVRIVAELKQRLATEIAQPA